MERQNPRTNGKSKPIQKKNHSKKHTYSLTKREKGRKKKHIYKERKGASKSINKSTSDNKL